MTEPNSHITAARPLFPEADIDAATKAIADVLRGGRLILGPHMRAVEAAYAEEVGVEHAVAVHSCTAALETCFRHYGEAGKEVIVPTNTFVATANAVRYAGMEPVFADMNSVDYGIDVDDAIAKMTERTKVVVVVHISGFIPVGIERLRDVCADRGVVLIEDCAHAHGARLDGVAAGALSQAGCFSFYPTKILTSGAGGMITTDDAELAALGRSLRHHGQGASLERIENAGNDWLLDEVRCVLLGLQLKRQPEFLATRRAVAARYDELLSKDDRITLPTLQRGMEPSYYKYPVLLPEGVAPGAIRSTMSEKHRVDLGALYAPPVHLMPVFQRELGTKAGMCPNAEALLARQVTLPMHAALSVSDADRVVEALDETLNDLS